MGPLLVDTGPAAAPDLLVFEVIAVLRRDVARGHLGERRARGAIEDLGDPAVDLFGEPLATKDGALAKAAREHTDIAVLRLGEPQGSG